MPNWCCNQMVVYGSPTETKDFREKILSALKKAEKTSQWSLYTIYEEFGYERQKILEDDTLNYIRGTIEDVSNVHYDEKYGSYIHISYESAWSPMLDGFDYLLSHHYNTLKQVTLCEECGNCVYINTDKTGYFFEEKYCLYVEDIDTYYIASDEELVEIFNSFIKNEEEKCHSYAECVRYLQNHDDMLDGNCASLEQYSPD